MRYCHECGAIVAPEDTFCSYCGITLEPMSPSMLGELAANSQSSIAVSEAAEKAEESLTDEQSSLETATPAEVANQTDLAIEAAVKSVPAAAASGEPDEEPPTVLGDDGAVDFNSIYNFKPPVKDEESKAVQAESYLPEKSVPAVLPDEFSEDSADKDEVEPETFFGYPLPVAKSAELPSSVPDETPSDGFFEKNPAEPEVKLASDSAATEPTPEPASEPTPVNHNQDDAYSEDMQVTLIGGNSKFGANQAAKSTEQAAPAPADDEDESETPTVIGGSVSQDIRLEGVEQNPSNELDLPPEQSQNFELQIGESIPGVQNLPGGKNVNQPPANSPAADAIAPGEPSERVPRQTEANRSQETPGNGGKAQKLKPLVEGTMLNRRYKIVRRIGGGGMGAVYLAEDQNLGGVLRAVKEMIQAYVDESQQEKAVQDFRRESVLLTQLDHSSIPTIYDYFFDEVNARFYLVMKYISGGDLAARLRSTPEGKLDEGSITEWAIQIADVLDYLHRRDPPIVYRDLKPSNIMLDGSSQNKAMLIDFGIARWVNKEEKGVTAVGTMGYAPPELFAGNAEPRSDIYSLGATMFHLLTGADPQSNPLLIFDFTKNPRPRQINMMISVEMEDILLRAVEYNSGLRFESAAKMRDVLREHLDKLRAGRLTFERKQNNPVQAMPIPAQAPPPVPFDKQPQVNMVFCGFCGEKIIASDSFCAYCGAPQQNSPTQKPSPNQMEQTMMPSNIRQNQKTAGGATARLVVLGTNELDAPLFPLEKETNLVGREDRSANIFPEVDLTRYDSKAQVSRRHARIWHDGSNFLVEDLRSSNGTVLISDDNQTVRLQANQPHVLQNGDKLRLGETTLKFYVN